MSLKYKPSHATILFLESLCNENLVWRLNYPFIPVSVDLCYFSIHLKVLYGGICWEIMSIAGV